MDIKKLIDDIEPYAKGWDISIELYRSNKYILIPKQKFNKKKILETIQEGDDIRIIDLTKNAGRNSILFYHDEINIYHSSKYTDAKLKLKADEYKKAFDIINEYIIFDAKLKTML